MFPTVPFPVFWSKRAPLRLVQLHTLNPRRPKPIHSLRTSPTAPIRIRQTPSIDQPLNATPDPIAARQAPHHPADLMFLRKPSDAVQHRAIVQCIILRIAELGEDNGGQPLRRRTVPGNITRGGRVDAEGVEAVAVESRFDDLAGPDVDVLA